MVCDVSMHFGLFPPQSSILKSPTFSAFNYLPARIVVLVRLQPSHKGLTKCPNGVVKALTPLLRQCF